MPLALKKLSTKPKQRHLFRRFKTTRHPIFSTDTKPPLTAIQPRTQTIDLKQTALASLGPILQDTALLFHGINYDITRLPSILSHGILSADSMKNRGLPLAFNYGASYGPALNGWTRISLALSPAHPQSAGYEQGAFGIFVQGKIAVIAQKSNIFPYQTSEMTTGEVQCPSLPPENIKGLLIPKQFLSTPISQIDFMKGGALGPLHMRCQRVYQFVRETYGLTNPSLIDQAQKPIEETDEHRIRQAFNCFLIEGLCKQFQKNADAILGIDAIRSLIPSSLPLYDERGFKFE